MIHTVKCYTIRIKKIKVYLYHIDCMLHTVHIETFNLKVKALEFVLSASWHIDKQNLIMLTIVMDKNLIKVVLVDFVKIQISSRLFHSKNVWKYHDENY